LTTQSTAVGRALRDEIARACDRIDALDPVVRAFLPEPDRRGRLTREAERLAGRFPDPQDSPALYGVLLGVKDIFNVDGFETRAGSELPPDLFAGPEASVVTRLKSAGALVAGKTVTTEFAFFEPGPTRNPRDPDHTPGGSSSGSAAAVAAGLCDLALGTQTIGSTIRPAAYCGVAGFKPSFGRVPLDGVVPFAPSLDHVGLFARDTAGLRRAAAVLGLVGSAAPVGSAATAGTLAGPLPVLGVPEGPYLEQASEEGRAAFTSHLDRLAAAGFAVRRVPALGDIGDINRRHRALAAAEMAAVHAAWFAEHGDRYRPRTAALIREGMAASADGMAAGWRGRLDLRGELEAAMDADGIDLWVSPAATGPAPRGIASTGDPVMNLPWTHAGLPVIGVPAGPAANGLPLGLQCAARFMDDGRVLGWAALIERALIEAALGEGGAAQ